jgi:uncharacterized membrane protein YedE/YeeE
MELINVTALANKIAWLAFALGAIFGAVAQRTHFCTMGAVADIVNMGDWNRMRQWLLAIAVAILGTNLLAFFGLIDLSKALYTGPRLTWLANLVGGLLFGFGMVLASGCGSKNLIRIGGGNLKSLVVFVVLGLTAFMTLKGILAVPRVALLESVSAVLPTNQDLPSLLSSKLGSKAALQAIIASAAFLLLAIFVFASKPFRTVDNILAGMAIGAIIVAAWYVSGRIGYLAEDPNTLQELFVATNSGKMEAFSFVAPYAYALDLLMLWTDTSKTVSFGIATALGVICGSFVYTIVSGSFRWEGFGNVEDTANHLIGAVLMGFGGITALGCTIGHGLSGLSTLAVGSMLAFFAIITGALLALKYQGWRMERML